MKRGFTIHHNGPPARCVGRGHDRCLSFWEAVRRFHVETQGWSGIAYSFGVCPHGVRLSGQGWDRRQFANGVDLVGANNGTDGDWFTVLVFVGGDVSTGDEEAPTATMIQATADLIAEGRRTGRCGTQVLPHKDFKQKPCPGSAFTALCREWHNRPLPSAIAAPPAPEPKEPEMYVFDCAGKPALVVGVGGVQALTGAQRSALKDTLGVEVKRKDDHNVWEALWSLRTPGLVVDVDEPAIAALLAAELKTELGEGADVAAIEAAVRRVFADAGTDA